MNSTANIVPHLPPYPTVRLDDYWPDMDELAEWAASHPDICAPVQPQPALPPHPTLKDAASLPAVTLVTLHETRYRDTPWRVDYSDGQQSAHGMHEGYLGSALYRLSQAGIEGKRIKIVAYLHSGW